MIEDEYIYNYKIINMLFRYLKYIGKQIVYRIICFVQRLSFYLLYPFLKRNFFKH